MRNSPVPPARTGATTATAIPFGASTFRARQAVYYNGGHGTPAHTRTVGPIDRLAPDTSLPRGTTLQLVLAICARRDMDEEDRVTRVAAKLVPPPATATLCYPRDLLADLPVVYVPAKTL
jgi:hypothetical protein